MSRRKASPSSLALDMTKLWFEAASVINLRVMQAAWQIAPAGEDSRMVSEKPEAFAKAGTAATLAAISAATRNPLDPAAASYAAASAWTRSLTGKAMSNRKRLSKTRA